MFKYYHVWNAFILPVRDILLEVVSVITRSPILQLLETLKFHTQNQNEGRRNRAFISLPQQLGSNFVAWMSFTRFEPKWWPTPSCDSQHWTSCLASKQKSVLKFWQFPLDFISWNYFYSTILCSRTMKITGTQWEIYQNFPPALEDEVGKVLVMYEESKSSYFSASFNLVF